MHHWRTSSDWKEQVQQALARQFELEQDAIHLPEWMVQEAKAAMTLNVAPAFEAIKAELERYGRRVLLSIDAKETLSASITVFFRDEQEYAGCWRLYSWSANEEDPKLDYGQEYIIAEIVDQYVFRVAGIHGIDLDRWNAPQKPWQEEFAAFMQALQAGYLSPQERLTQRNREATFLIESAARPAFEQIVVELTRLGRRCTISFDAEDQHTATLSIACHDLDDPFVFTWQICPSAEDDCCLLRYHDWQVRSTEICQTFAVFYATYLWAKDVWDYVPRPTSITVSLRCLHRQQQGTEIPLIVC